MQSSFNYTSLGTDQFGLLVSVCDLVGQIERMAALNISDYSESKHTQLEAMKITGALVEENICDWVSIDLPMNENCSSSYHVYLNKACSFLFHFR